jgi:hypothetical protein
VYIGNFALESLSKSQLAHATADEIRSMLILCATGLSSYGKSSHVCGEAGLLCAELEDEPVYFDIVTQVRGPEDTAVNEQDLINHAHRSVPESRNTIS